MTEPLQRLNPFPDESPDLYTATTSLRRLNPFPDEEEEDPLERKRAEMAQAAEVAARQNAAVAAEAGGGKPSILRPGLTGIAGLIPTVRDSEMVRDLDEALMRGASGIVGAVGGVLEREGRKFAEKPQVEVPLLPVPGFPTAKIPLPGVAGKLGEAAAKAGEGLEAVQAAVQEVHPRPDYAQTFWQGMKTDPAKTMAVSAAENLPNMVAVIAASAVNPALGMGTAYALEAGGAYQEAKESGATEDQAREISGWVGLGNMALEYLPAGRLLKQLPGGTIAAKRALMTEMLKQGASEGVTESLQEANQVISQALTTEKWPSFQDFAKRIGESLVTGTFLGIFGGGAGAAVQPQVEQAAAPPVEEVEAPPPVEAMAHAGSDVSPEAISRVARGERYVRISPGGEVVPILNDVAAVDVQVNPGEVKAVVGVDGAVRVEQGRPNAAQARSLEIIAAAPPPIAPRQVQEQPDSIVEELPPAAEEDLLASLGVRRGATAPLTQINPFPEEVPRETSEAQKAEAPEAAPVLSEPSADVPEVAAEPALPGRIVSRQGEAGVLAVPTPSTSGPVKRWLRRHFSSAGSLPNALFDTKVARDNRVAARLNRIDALARDLAHQVRRYRGPLTREQLSRYLDDAYRGMNLRTGGETLDETQIQRIARQRGIAPETVREQAARTIPESEAGLREAPHFIPIIREMRQHTDALTRSLRRVGLLDDAVARELERSFGLYVHRQYEAVRNEKWAERIKKQPLWNRAFELTRDKWPAPGEPIRARHLRVGMRVGYQGDYGRVISISGDDVTVRLWSKAQKRSADAVFQASDLEAPTLVPKTDSEIWGMLESYIDRAGGPGRIILPGGTPEGAKDLSILRERTDQDDFRRLLLGEIREAGSNFFTTAAKMATLLEQQKFLDDFSAVGQQLGVLTTRPDVLPTGEATKTQIDPGMYAKAIEKATGIQPEIGETPGLDRLVVKRSGGRTKTTETTKKADPLGGLYTTDEINSELQKIFEHESFPAWLRYYMTANYGVKAFKTVGSIQATARNFLSNFLYVTMQGVNPLNPKQFAEAGKVSYPRVFGNTNREMMNRVEEYQRLGLFDQGTDLGDLKRQEREAQIFRGQMVGAGRTGARIVRGFQEFYQAPDNFSKAYAFESLLPEYRKAYPNLPEAEVKANLALVLRDTMQNYSQVPRGIQMLSGRFPLIAPFLSFTEEIVRNTKNTAIIGIREAKEGRETGNKALENLGRRKLLGLAVAYSIPSITAAIGHWLFNTDDEEEEAARHFLPPWTKNGTVIVDNKGNGEIVVMDLSFMDTFSQIKDPVLAALRGDLDGAMEELLTPVGEEILSGALLDIKANKKPTGGEIYNPQDFWLPRQLDKARYVWKVGAPGTLLTAKKIYDALKSRELPEGQRRVLWQEVMAIAGPRISTYNLGRGITFKAYAYKDAIRYARKLETAPASKGKRAAADLIRPEEKTIIRIKEILLEMDSDIEAARTLGLDDEKIRAALREGNVGKREAQQLLDGDHRGIMEHLLELNQEQIDEAQAVYAN